MHQKTYANVGDLISRPVLGDEEKPPREFGDLSEEVKEAEEVLANWFEVARYNVGEGLALEVMQRLRNRIQ